MSKEQSTKQTYVISKEVSRKALGSIAKRGVIMGISSKDEQSSSQQHRWMQVSWVPTFSKNSPATPNKHYWAFAPYLRLTSLFLFPKYISTLLPCAGLNLIAVKIIHQAVFVCWERSVTPVDIHTPAASVIHTAVAVSTLSNRSSGLRHQPRVCPCTKKQNHNYFKIKIVHL